MSASHTPGPWAWWTSCSFRRLSHRNDGDVLYAAVHSDGQGDVVLPNGGWDGPDGRLIAAAPDLLASNEAMVAALDAAFGIVPRDERLDFEGMPTRAMTDAYFAARAAIAKARGEGE